MRDCGSIRKHRAADGWRQWAAPLPYRFSDSRCSFHRSTIGLSHRNARWIEAFQTEHVDAKIVRRDPFAMERVNATPLAEEVACGHRVESVLGKPVLAGEQFELGLVDFHHERILATADRAVTRGQLQGVSLNLECDRAAMTAATILLHRLAGHAIHFRRRLTKRVNRGPEERRVETSGPCSNAGQCVFANPDQ